MDSKCGCCVTSDSGAASARRLDVLLGVIAGLFNNFYTFLYFGKV